MIFETEFRIEYIDNPMILLIVFTAFVFFMLFTTIEIYNYISRKIHKSYHKGYNRAKDDTVEYYSVLFTLNSKYKEIMKSLKSSEVVLKVNTVEHFIEFENMLKDFQEKSN